MDLFFVLLAFAVVTSPGEMKTVEELEEEVNFLKMKIDNMEIKFETKTENLKTKFDIKINEVAGYAERIEKKVDSLTIKVDSDEKIKNTIETISTNVKEKSRNTTDDRLNYLEELSKLSVMRTCDEMYQFGITTSDFYFVDPDGPLIGSEPFRVWCDFTKEGLAITEILHNSEEVTEVGHCKEPGCYVHPVAYTAPDDQIESLIQMSKECEQTVRYDCLLAPLMYNDVNFGFWLDKHSQPQVYWDGAHAEQHVCSCFYQEEGCLEEDTKYTQCNCDAQVPEIQSDVGSITNKTALPITQLQFGGLVYDMQQAFHTLGRLRCWGKVEFDEGTSCAAIKRSGQYHSGFFNIRKNETTNSQLVFCNMTSTPGYEDDDQNEEYVESSEDHFKIVEEEIGKLKDDISANEGKISILEYDVNSLRMRSSFCGSQDSWTSANSVITYDSLLVDDSNIVGSSFNTTNGLFTAGVTGVYQVDLSIGRLYSSSSEYDYIVLRLNGVSMVETQFLSYINIAKTTYEAGGRSMLVNMAKGDTIEVYGTHILRLNFITFCVSLVN